jgi:hypothetical protein
MCRVFASRLYIHQTYNMFSIKFAEQMQKRLQFHIKTPKTILFLTWYKIFDQWVGHTTLKFLTNSVFGLSLMAFDWASFKRLLKRQSCSTALGSSKKIKIRGSLILNKL